MEYNKGKRIKGENGSGGCVEYGELASEVFGGFTFENDYDKKKTD